MFMIRSSLLVLSAFTVQNRTTEPGDKHTYPCELWESIEIEEPLKHFENGSILSNNITFPPNQIFYDNSDIDRNETVTRGCLCSLKICLQKCCPIGSSMRKNRCVPDPMQLSLNLINFYTYNNNSGQIEFVNNTDKADYIIAYYPIKDSCNNGEFAYFEEIKDEFYILENGSTLLINNTDNDDEIVASCLEWEENDKKVALFTCKIKLDMQYQKPQNPARKLYQKWTESTHNSEDVYDIVMLKYLDVGMFVSILFLLIVFFVYCITPELQNTFGKSLLSQVACLIALYIAILMNHSGPRFIFELIGLKTSCTFLGYVSHYALLSNFLWLTVMCFDIWLMFSGTSRSYCNMSKTEELQRYIKYSCYAWGMSLLICIAMYMKDVNLYTVEPKTDGVMFCLMKWEHVWMLFYICPFLITGAVNIVLFFATAFNIYKCKRQSRRVLQSESSNSGPVETDSFRVKLFFRLCLVMVASSHGICEPMTVSFHSEPKWFWLMFDWINAIHGITVFVIFVCNKRIIHMFNKSITHRFMNVHLRD